MLTSEHDKIKEKSQQLKLLGCFIVTKLLSTYQHITPKIEYRRRRVGFTKIPIPIPPTLEREREKERMNFPGTLI